MTVTLQIDRVSLQRFLILGAKIQVMGGLRTIGLIVCLLALMPTASAVQGQPLMVRIKPDLDSYPQHFDITRAGNGFLYLATAGGLAVYDGESWSSLSLPAYVTGRSLSAIDDSDSVLVGAYGDFGIVAIDQYGEPEFQSYVQHFPDLQMRPQLDPVWQAKAHQGWHWFRTATAVFALQPESGQTWIWNPGHNTGPLLQWQGALYVTVRSEGLYRLQAGSEPQRVEGTDELGASLVEASLIDGAAIFRGRLPWLLYWDGKEVSRIDWLTDLPDIETLVSLTSVGEHTLVLGSRSGDIHLVDMNTRQQRQIRLSDDRIDQLAADPVTGFWALTHRELVHVQWPPNWEVFDSSQGLFGTVNRVVEQNDRLTVATSSGVYCLCGKDRFELQDWTSGEAWDLQAVGEGMLLAESNDLLFVDQAGETVSVLPGISPRLILPASHGGFWIGTDNGVWHLNLDANEYDKPEAEQVLDQGLVRTMTEHPPGTLWVGSYGNGVARVTPDTAQDSRVVQWVVVALGPANAAAVTRVDGELWVSGENRLYLWQDDSLVEQTGHELLSVLRPNFSLTATETLGNGDIWMGTYRHVVRRHHDKWIPTRVESYRSGAFGRISQGRGDSVWIGGTGALYRYRPGMGRAAIIKPRLQLREISIQSQDESTRLPLSADQSTVPVNTPLIHIRYAAPEFTGPVTTSYRTRLNGVSSVWSEWSRDQTITLTDLSPGDYRFEVQARSGSGEQSDTVAWNFQIAAHWTESMAGRMVLAGMLAIAGFLLAMLINRWRVSVLQAQNIRLDRLVQERTTALETANSKLRDMAEHDGLTGLFNRLRLDSALSAAWQDWCDSSIPFGVILIDADHFKKFNDRHGHLAGDDLLRQIATICADVAADHDGMAARYGGEEFAILLSEINRQQIAAIAERLRSSVDRETVITISAGISVVSDNHDSAVDVLDQADQGLYLAKDSGRDRVCYHDDREERNDN